MKGITLAEAITISVLVSACVAWAFGALTRTLDEEDARRRNEGERQTTRNAWEACGKEGDGLCEVGIFEDTEVYVFTDPFTGKRRHADLDPKRPN